MRIFRLKLWLLAVLAMSLSVACNGPRYGSDVEASEGIAGVAVRVEETQHADPQEYSAPLSGTVISDGQVSIGFQLSGKVTSVLVEEGQAVAKGQILARLDDRIYAAQHVQASGAIEQARAQLAMLENGSRPEEVATAEASLASARAVLERSTADNERMQVLFRQGVISRSELENVSMEFKRATLAVESAEQQLSLVRQGPREEQISQARAMVSSSSGNLSMASTQLDYTVLRAPIAGTLVSRMLEVGETVAAGVPVMQIANLGKLEVRTEVPEGDLSRIRQGDEARLSFPASPGSQATAVVSSIAPMASQLTRAFPVTLTIDEAPEGIVPGMVALTRFAYLTSPGGVVIRESAIIDGHVFVIRDGLAVRLPVETLADRGGKVHVSGLEAGEQLVVNGQHRISDGDRVILVDALGISEITRLESK